MIRLGLCCAFRDEPIGFRTTTAAAVLRRGRVERLRRIGAIASENAAALHEAIRFCAANGIGSFRINSQILPLRTHPTAGYPVEELPGAAAIIAAFRSCGRLAEDSNVRLTFHPDQFVVLNSPRAEVLRGSVAELEYQGEVAEWVGADVIIIHGGGAYGDKRSALERLRSNLGLLSPRVRSRIALENDDRVYTPADLLPLCESSGVPFVYDVHHHRCLRDGLSEMEVTERAAGTWNREPVFHISSPAGGWRADNVRVHDDFVGIRDFPACWYGIDLTVEIEARAKEAAVLRLRRWLMRRAAAV